MSRAPAHHRLDVWPGHVWAASSLKQLRKASKAIGLAETLTTDSMGRTWAYTGPGGLHLIVYVDVKHHDDVLELIDTCAHEASHAADGVFEYVEEDKPGAESRAYLVGWLTRWLFVHCDPRFSGSIAQKKERP